MSLHVFRHDSILEILDDESEVRVARLAEQLKVSEMTIRRDLQVLERQGKLRRVYGGAVRTSRHSLDDVSERATRQAVEKRAIAECAVTLLEPGMDVFIGGGSTTALLAEQAGRGPAVRYATNSLDVASILSERSERDIQVLGGALRRGARTLIGPETIEMIESRSFDLTFIGIAAIETRHGFLEPTEWHAWLVRTLRARTSQLVVLADHTKFAAQGDLRVLGFEEADLLVSDAPPPASHARAIADAGLRVQHAKAGNQ